MGLFGGNKRVSELEKELKVKDGKIKAQDRRIKKLEDLCEEKDSYFMELISDGLRHGSSLAAKHMSDRKKYLNGR